MHKVSFLKTEQLTLYTYVERKKERRREKRGLQKATTNAHITIRAYLGLAKTRELMHDGGEMTTTDGTDTGGIKVIKRYQNNLRYIKG